MKVYYAHSILKYNTDIEKYEMSLIPYCIANPNGCVDQTLSEPEIMRNCFELIDNCDGLVFSSLSGVIGKGVADEIEYALQTQKPVFYLFNNKLNPVKTITIKPMENSQSKRFYATFEWRGL